MIIDSRQNPNKYVLFDSAFPENNWAQPPISHYNIQFGETIRGELMDIFFQMSNAENYYAAISDDLALIQELEAWDLASDIDLNLLDL